MKYKLTSAIGLLLIFCSSLSFCRVSSTIRGYEADNVSVADTIKVMSSPELMTLVNTWAEKFSKLNPIVKVTVLPVDGSAAGNGMVQIISKKKDWPEATGTGWEMVIGHNAVVPVINADNPMLNEIMVQGISSTGFKKVTSGIERPFWSDIIRGGGNDKVHFFYRDGTDVSESIAKFTGNPVGEFAGTAVDNTQELISLVEKDKYSIGFCRLSEIRLENKNELGGNIRLLPIDRNGNRRIDTFESIYENPDELTRGIWIGKYPSSLCGSIFATSTEKPSEKNELAFLTWIITNGSDYLGTNGFVSLVGVERDAGLAALNLKPVVSDIQTTSSYALFIILASLIALVIIISVLITRSARSRKTAPATSPVVRSAFNESVIESPKGLFFDKSHTWTFMEKDGLVRFGVDDFIQHVTGIITGIRFKKPGDNIRRGEKILSIIKDGKQIELYSPISGTIKSINNEISSDPSLFNSSPYSNGWIYLIEPASWAREIQVMFMEDKYRQWLKDEFVRLRLFLGSVMRENSAGAYIIMQDGGEMTDHPLSDLDPEVWEEFQTRFIDTSR